MGAGRWVRRAGGARYARGVRPGEDLSNPEAPHPQQPVVQRLRIRYAKRGRLRFTSHRDVGRALERAIRRAGVPVGFSSGFSPHPKVSYGGASPTGVASEAEYVEIGVTRPCVPAQVCADLDDSLPDGLDVLEVVVAQEGTGSLADRLQASAWTIHLEGVEPRKAEAAVATFMAQDSVEVERMTKKGMRTFDCRAAVVRLASASGATHDQPCAIMNVVVRHGTPAVRPDDVLAGLRAVAGLEPPVPPKVSRSAQGPLDPQDGTVGDPFVFDRDAS